MDELIIGLVVGSVVALCLYVILNTVVQNKERKNRDPKSKMTANELWTIVVTLLLMAFALVAGVAAFGTF
jgi:ABC-type branched-subunit amino acid transport system permease subunit